MIKPIFTKDSVYHIYNRGVEKRVIFNNDKDYLRFIHNMYEFNDEARAKRFTELRTRNKKTRRLLVEIMVFCLMPNHFHLILRQVKEGGIIRFVKKLCLGYAMYFNKKYDRVGALFQGRFKALEVKEDEYLMQLSRYIHLNPLKQEKLTSIKSQKELLVSYRWSSYLDYIGRNNFPSTTERSLLLGMFKNKENYESFVVEGIKGNYENYLPSYELGSRKELC